VLVNLSRQLRVRAGGGCVNHSCRSALHRVDTQAQAFFVRYHERITRDALPPDLVDPSACSKFWSAPRRVQEPQEAMRLRPICFDISIMRRIQ
jgi:hypothetical protein